MSARTITTNIIESEEIIEMPSTGEESSPAAEEEDNSDIIVETGNDTVVAEELPPCNNPLQCRYCGKIFTRSFYRKEHERIHTGEKPYACSFCSKRFNSHGSCRKHERTHLNATTRRFDCDHCGRKFHDVTSLKIHSRSHQTGEKPYSCHICGRSFGFDTVLKKHMLFHSGSKPFQCTVCEKSYFTAYDLRVHIRGHTGEKPYKCRHCNLMFATGRRRNIHEKTHLRHNAHQCTKCGRTFRTANTLSIHQMKSQMTGDCEASEPEIVYENGNAQDDSNFQNGQINGHMAENEHIFNEDENGMPILNKESDVHELDISVLAHAVEADLSTFSTTVPSPEVFPTGLIRTTENGIKPEPLSHLVDENTRINASPTMNDLPQLNNQPNRRNSFLNTNQSDGRSSFQIEAGNDSQSESRSINNPQLSIITCDHKGSQTEPMKDVDLMFSEMAAARTIHECKSCGIIFRDYTMFLVHKTLHINPHKPFMCHLCGKESHDKVEFHSHMIWHMK